MRAGKICTIVALVLGVSTLAGAVSIPLNQPYAGPVYMHMVDYTMGSVYDPSGQPLDTWLPAGSVPLFAGATGGIGLESGWSIIKIDQIYKGSKVGTNTITQLASVLYDNTSSAFEVLGLVHGQHDLFVRFNNDGTQSYLYAGGVAELYVQPVGTMATETRTFLGLPLNGSGDPASGIFGAAGSSGRLAASKYVGIGFDSLGNAIPNTLALTLKTEAGYYPLPVGSGAPAIFDTAEGTAKIAFDPITGAGSGDSDAYYSVTGGSAAGQWDTNGFVPNRPGVFVPADFRVHATNSPIIPVGTYDWLLQSSDPITSYVIPEPMTVLGVFLGVSSLAGYIRKRRNG